MTNKDLPKCDRIDSFWDNVLYEDFPSKYILELGPSVKHHKVLTDCLLNRFLRKNNCPALLKLEKVLAFPKFMALALFQISFNHESGLLDKY